MKDHQGEDQEQPANAVQIAKCSKIQLCDAHYCEVLEQLRLVKSVKNQIHKDGMSKAKTR